MGTSLICFRNEDNSGFWVLDSDLDNWFQMIFEQIDKLDVIPEGLRILRQSETVIKSGLWAKPLAEFLNEAESLGLFQSFVRHIQREQFKQIQHIQQENQGFAPEQYKNVKEYQRAWCSYYISDFILRLVLNLLPKAHLNTLTYQAEQLPILVPLVDYLVKVVPDGYVGGFGNELSVGHITTRYDYLWWCSKSNQQCTVKMQTVNQFCEGSPDLVIGLYRNSNGIDLRREHFKVFEQHAVQEYWIVEPAGSFVEVFVRNQERLVYQGLCTFLESFTSPILGKNIDLNEVFYWDAIMKSG